jgi:hypothetical protein
MNPGLLAPLLAYGDALDRKDWASARACFLPEVEADYRALRGTREVLSAEAFVARREAALAPLLTRHRVEPLEVEEQGGKARVRSRYRIERVDPRRPAPNHLHTEGEYEHRLRRYPEGWRIVAVRQTLTFEDGDRSIRVGAAQAPEASR